MVETVVPLSSFDTMMQFSVYMLDSVGDFLGSEPIIYLFGLVCLVVILKAFKSILP